MKNFKKVIALLLAAVLLVAGSVMGTIAYLTDSDGDVNTMVAGNVKIVQNETDRNGNAYVDGKKLLPAVYNGTLSYDGTMNDTDGNGTLQIFDKSVENELDKVISVTNTGTEAAYIRTIILMENTADNAICAKIHTLENNNDGQKFEWLTHEGGEVHVSINGTLYSIAVCTYNTALEAGATSSPSLMQLFLDPSADNGWYDLLGGDGKFSVIAFSQAVQAQGFNPEKDADGNITKSAAAVALDAAFGEPSAANVFQWVTETGIDTTGEANKIGG